MQKRTKNDLNNQKKVFYDVLILYIMSLMHTTDCCRLNLVKSFKL